MNKNLKEIYLIISGFIGFVASIIGIVTLPIFFEHIRIWIYVIALFILLLILFLLIRYLLRKNKDIQSLQNRVAFLEKERNVPFFKKWPLVYAHLWKSGKTPIPVNPIVLDLFKIEDEILPGSRQRNTKISFYFKGKFIEEAWKFFLTIGGDENTTYENLHFTAKDLRTNETLKAKIVDGGRNETIKDIVLSFKDKKEKGDMFEILVNWTWPKMLLEKSDYISLPNIYSVDTKKIILTLIVDCEMKINSIEAYKYGTADNEPTFLRTIYPDSSNEKIYSLEIENPEMNADYLMYYE